VLRSQYNALAIVTQGVFMDRPGYIYLLRLEQDPDPLKCAYKIGRTNDLRNRQKLIGVLMPYPVTLVWAIETSEASATERMFHDLLRDVRMHGEWFQLERWQLALFVVTGLSVRLSDHDLDPEDPGVKATINMIIGGGLSYDGFCAIEAAARAAISPDDPRLVQAVKSATKR
jgi:Meiotically up-regulated gene 113